MTKAVLVIGAGPSGMAQVNALVGAADLEVRCFEMNSEIGGLWTWTDDVGDCHGSMYRYHQTNGLNEFLELEEYSFLEHFGHLITSYPPRAVMLDYLRGWTTKMGGDKCITLNRKVTSVTYDAKKFTVVSHDTTNDARHIDYFDSVVCCNGHFSVPNWVPPLKGLADFKGRVIHAHSFRDAQDFKGQRLLLIGNGYSGEDIAMQCVKFGAARATIGFRTAAAGHDFQDWPIVERKLPTHYDRASGEFKFEDGDGLEVDCVIYCTGYRHTFPFLDEPLQLRTANRLAPDTLWKGIVHPDCTSLYFVGMPDQYYTFTMFDAQARFVRGCLEGRVAFPDRKAMLADTAAWQKKEDEAHASGDHAKHHQFQLAHTNDACALVGFQMRDDGDLLIQWQDDRHRDILKYRDCTAVSKVDGSRSLIYNVPWTMMFTDDKVSYLEWCKAKTLELVKQGKVELPLPRPPP